MRWTRRCEIYDTLLNSYDEPDEAFPVDIPEGLSFLRQAVQSGLPAPTHERQSIRAAVIQRSLLGPFSKTYLAADEGPFVVVEPTITVDDVQRWAARP